MKAVAINRILIVLGFVGLFIAGFLSISHILHLAPPCTASDGCAKVLNHESSKWFDIPVAYFGFAGYAALTALACIRAFLGLSNSKIFTSLAYVISGIGTLASVYLQYEALAMIHEFCPYCFGSAITMTVTFILTAILANLVNSESDIPSDSGFDVKLTVGLALALIVALFFGKEKIRADGRSMIASVKYDESVRLVPEGAHIYGAAEAPITVVEFSDLLCPTCQLKTPELINFIDSHAGKIRLVYRHFPLEHPHPMAYVAASTSEYAATKMNFFTFAHSMMAVKSNPSDADEIFRVAKANGLDESDLKKHLENESDPIHEAVARDRRDASTLGVSGTPTFFIMINNNQKGAQVVSSNELFEALKEPRYESILNGK